MEELAISRLCKEFLKNKESIVQGKIHSVFKNVINIEFILHSGEERIITLLTQSSLGLPDSAIITDTCYNNIISIPDYTSIRIIKKNNLIIFGNTGFKIALKQDAGWGEHKDFTVYKPDLNRIRQFISEHRKISSNRKKDGFSKLGQYYIKALTGFINGFFNDDEMQVWDSYNKIIGAGIGLTPACDDAMIGAMSVIYHLCLSEYNFSLGQYFENTKRIRNDLVQYKKTTDISRKYLICACEGYFSEPLINISKWVLGKKSGEIRSILDDFYSIGHSSGLDMLIGVKKVFDVLLGV